MHDSMNNLTEREKRILQNSWADGFSKFVFPAINEERFSVLYSERAASRPSTPVNIVIGTLLLKEMFGLTDEEMMNEVTFNIQYQYALNTTSFEEQPINDRTLSRFRERVYKYEQESGRDLIQEEMLSLAEHYGKFMGVNRSITRMDSMMVSANARRMTRLSLMFKTVRMMAEAVRKAGGELPEEFYKYLKDSESEDIGYRLKKEEVLAKMEEILRDALSLSSYCEESYLSTDEYRKLLRMIEDQSKEADGERVLKENNEILPNSMQNPSDEDATYRKKGNTGHVGYTLNIEESCSENGQLVMGYSMEPNTYSDVQFAKDVIDNLPEENDREVIITDGAYGSAEVLEKAEEKGVALAATTLIGGVEDNFEARFELDEESKTVLRCPAGHEPLDSKYNEEKEEYRSHFDKETCENCPYCDRCPGIFQVKRALIRFTKPARIRAEYFDKMNTEEYEEFARKRNGVEGVPSVLRRRYSIDQIPVRGLMRSKLWIGFKIGAMNTVRLLKAVAFPRVLYFYWQFKRAFQILNDMFLLFTLYPVLG
jgi:hypothetical protein